MAIFASSTLFALISRCLIFFMGFSVGCETRAQWREAGLLEKMRDVLFLRILGFVQVCVASSQVAETVVWFMARAFGQYHLYLSGESKFTIQGAELVDGTATFAILAWALALALTEDQFQRIRAHPTFGPYMSKMNTLFWALSAVIGLQIFLNTSGSIAFCTFCMLRVISFSLISQESPGWHMLTFYAFSFLGNPIKPGPCGSAILHQTLNHYANKF